MTTKSVEQVNVLGKSLEREHGDVLRSLLATMLRHVMESEATQLCGAGYGERSDDRSNQRNGYRERDFETRLGSVELAIPKLRQGSYMPSFLEARRRWERGFVSVVAEAYVNGVSTRKVERLVEAMGAQGMSRSEVSRMATELDAQVEEFRNRPLQRAYPYL